MADRVELLIRLNGDTAALRALQSIEQMTNGLNGKTINLNMNNATHQVYSLRDAINSIGTAVSTVGNQIGTLGNTFTGLGNMFGGDILNIATRTLVSKATSIATQGIGRAVSRYDTFKTYPKLLELMGFSAEDAQVALDKLNDAVLGLPTSLDEMAEMSKQFIMFYQDIGKGTDLAIAANNAFLANGSDSQQVTFGLRQIRDILSKGTLKSMEWESLLAALGTSLVPIAEQFGYTADQIGEFRAALKDGAIDGNDFLDALIAVGQPGGILAERANLLKDTLDAAATNIRTAFANLGASVLQELDKVLDEQTGKNLVENLIGISDAMKKQLIPAVRDWISSHPDEIVEVFNDLKSFDWMSLLSSIGTGAVSYFEHLKALFEWLVDTFGQENIIKFITFATVWASPLGRALTLISKPIQLLGSMISLFSRAPGLGMIGRLSRRNVIVQMAQTFADVFKVLVGAAGMVGVMYLFGQVVKEYVGIAEMIGHADFGNFNANFPVIASLMGNIAFVTGGITGIMTAINALGGGKYAILGEIETAGLIGIIGFAGLVLDQLTDLMVKVGHMDLGNYDANVGAVEQVFLHLGGLVAAVDLVLSGITALGGGVGGAIVGIGEALTFGFFAQIDYAVSIIKKIVGLIGDVSAVKLPTDAKIHDVGHVLSEMAKAFKEIDFSTNFNVLKLANIAILAYGLSLFYNALDSLDKMTKKEIDKEAITRRLAELQEIIEGIDTLAKGVSDATTSKKAKEDFVINLMRNGILGSYWLMLKEFDAIIDEIVNLDPSATGAEAGRHVLNAYNDPYFDKIKKLEEIAAGLQRLADAVGNTSGIFDTYCTLIINGMKDVILFEYIAMLKEFDIVIDQIAGMDPDEAGVTLGESNNPFQQKILQLEEMSRWLQRLEEAVAGTSDIFTAKSAAIRGAIKVGILFEYDLMLKEFNNLIDTLQGIDPTEAGAEAKIDDPFHDKIAQLTEIGTAMDDFVTEITNFKTVFTGQAELVKTGLELIITDLQGMIVDKVQELADKIAALNLTKVPGYGEGEDTQQFSDFIDGVGTFLEDTEEALNKASGKLGPFSAAAEAWESAWNAITVDNLATAMAQLSGLFAAMRIAFANHEWMNNITQSDVDQFVENAVLAITAVDGILNNDALESLWSLTTGSHAIGSEDFATALERYATIVSAINQFIQAMTMDEDDPVTKVNRFYNVLGSVENIIEKINGMGELFDEFNAEDSAGQKFGTIMQTLLEAIGGEDAEESIKLMEEMVPFLQSINEVLLAIVEVDLTDLNEQMSQLITYIVDLNTNHIPTLINQTALATTSTNNLTAAVQQLGNEADLAAPKIDNLSAQISILSEEMIIAYDQAINLAAAIMAIPDRTIHFGVDGMEPLMPTPMATGGLVDWSPQGTDIIPAMLTPGEFIIKRRAAQALGTRVLHQLNNLNIPGAIDALMARVSLPSSGRIVAYDNHRQYDNHATVNQYFDKSVNPAFTYRRASRFVGAL